MGEVPQEQSVDGRSFASLLRGERDEGLEKRDLFWHHPHYGIQGGDPSSIIRSGPWKLMPQLEAEHAEYLDPDWEPNDDWWGSQVTAD